MQRTINSKSKIRILIKNSPSKTWSSSINQKYTISNKNNQINLQKFSSIPNSKSHILKLCLKNNSRAIHHLNLQNNQNRKSRFPSIQSKKPLIIDVQRHSLLNEIDESKKCLILNNISNLQSEKCQSHTSNKQNIKYVKIAAIDCSKHSFFQKIDDQLEQNNGKFKLDQKNNKQQNKILKLSIGVQTQKIQFQRQGYNEYLKFKINKKQKYQKIQNLFNFFEKLSHLQNQNLINFSKGYNNKQNKNTKLNNQRQKRVQQLKDEFYLSYQNLSQEFKTNIIKLSKIQIEQLFNEQLFNSYSKFYTKYLNNIKNQIFDHIQCKKQTKTKLKKIFLEMQSDLQQFDNFKNQQLNQFKCQFQKFNTNLQQKFKIWENKLIQYTTIVKNCVINISELPQMCSKLFGFGQQKNHDKTNDQVKRFGVDVHNIPNISDFFTRNDTSNLEQIDKAFSKCCQIKCMNCVYLRSKMKYIYNKNIQLEPIKQALLKLTGNKSKMIKTSNQEMQLNQATCFKTKPFLM